MSKKREYDEKYKVQAVKLAKTSDQQKQQQRSCKFQSQNKNPESYGSIDWQGFLFGEISKVFQSNSSLVNKVARKLN